MRKDQFIPAGTPMSQRRMVVISNRTIAEDGAHRGGLAVAVSDALREAGGLWFGWSGAISDSAETVQYASRAGVAFVLTDLTPDEHEGYYLGYSNRALWPTLHYRVDLARCEDGAFGHYASVNRRFARHLVPLLRPDDLVVVHDYHLMLLARELRLAGWRGVTGFFLHVPFPPPEMFATLPQHAELGRALADFDLVGFQTAGDAANFRRYLTRYAGAAAHGDGLLSLGRRSLRVAHVPVGIDHAEFRALQHEPQAIDAAARLHRTLGARALVIGVDRLDYTKGLVQRLQGFERLLQRDPELQGRVSLLQIAAPSRCAIDEYRRLADEVARAAGRINGAFGDLHWTPVQHLAQGFPRAALSGLYRVARVGLVTSVRDGMNLSAKEFVAAQDPNDPGVLVLSRFAGAADQMTEALLVNPHDADCVADAIRRALAMPLAERRRRWQALDACVAGQDAAWWQRRFMAALRTSRPAASPLLRPVTDGMAEAV